MPKAINPYRWVKLDESVTYGQIWRSLKELSQTIFEDDVHFSLHRPKSKVSAVGSPFRVPPPPSDACKAPFPLLPLPPSPLPFPFLRASLFVTLTRSITPVLSVTPVLPVKLARLYMPPQALFFCHTFSICLTLPLSATLSSTLALFVTLALSVML